MNTSDLHKLLDRCGVTHQAGPLGVQLAMLKHGELPVGMSLLDGGQIIQLRSIGLLEAPDRRYRRALLTALMHMNYQYKLVKYGFDPSDGEIVAYIDLYVADSTVTDEQFKRCVRAYERLVPEGKARLQTVVRTGADPGPQSVDRGVLDELMAALAADAPAPPTRPTASGRPATKPAPAPNPEPPKTGSGGFGDLLDNILGDVHEPGGLSDPADKRTRRKG